jgi:transposase
MSSTYRAYNLDQQLLLPPNMRDWLPEAHLALFVSDVVDNLDLSELLQGLTKTETRGKAGYHPVMLVKLLIYAYCTGKPSSRRIEKATYEEVPYRVLSADQHPDHDTIADFRKRTIGDLAALFVQVLVLCREAGLIKLGHVALDGTKVKANASKHKAMSYGRMSEAEQKLQAEVQKLLAEAEQIDKDEDGRYGKGKHGDELPKELARRDSRLKKIGEAKAALEQEAKEQAAKQAAEAIKKNQEKDDSGQGGKRFTVPEVEEAKPNDMAQRNFTDPDSRIMLDGASKGFVYGYNCQAAVDAQCQVIVAADVTQQANDKQQLVPMLSQVKDNMGALPESASADAGYFSEAAVTDPSLVAVQLYVPPQRQKRGEQTPPHPEPNPEPSVAEQMKAKLAQPQGQAIYKMRKAIVEPVFGQTKEVRGFRRFSLRGLKAVHDEWLLISLSHNLLKLFRYGGPLAT